MEKGIDEYIEERRHKLGELGDDQAEAILLLAQKVGDVERAINAVEGALGAIFSVMDAMLGQMDRR